MGIFWNLFNCLRSLPWFSKVTSKERCMKEILSIVLLKTDRMRLLQSLGDSIWEKSYHSFKMLNVILWSWFVLLILGQTKRWTSQSILLHAPKKKLQLKKLLRLCRNVWFNKPRFMYHNKNVGNVEYSNWKYERTRLQQWR